MKDSDKTICIVVTWLAYGGAEVQVLNLAKGLKLRGWKVEVVSLRDPIEFVTELNLHDIQVFSPNLRPNSVNFIKILKLALRIKKLSPYIVHSHMVHANLITRILKPFYSRSILINTAHNIYEGGILRSFLYTHTDFLSQLTTNVSEAATSRYVNDGLAKKNKIRTVHNGIDTDMFQPNTHVRITKRAELGLEDSFVWICIARFVPAKDHSNLLKAFQQVAREHHQAKLLLVGEGPLKDEVIAQSVDMGIEKQIEFLGIRDDVEVLINCADAYVMSSAWEGMPLVLLEAGANGLPIVSTSVGGTSEAMISSPAHQLVPPRDHKALAIKMCEIMLLPEIERINYGRTNSLWVKENYSMSHILDVWEDLYRNFREQA